MPTAPQSATLAQLQTAAGAALAARLPHLYGIDATHIFLGFRDAKECPTDGESVVFYRTQGWLTREHPGAGRLGYRWWPLLEVVVQTRNPRDRAGRDQSWSDDADRGHTALQHAVIEVLCGDNLFSAYDADGNPTEAAVARTVEPAQLRPGGRIVRPKEFGGWGYSVLGFLLNTNLPLTV